jgi:chromosomal replication initiation ATPase DnaA
MDAKQVWRAALGELQVSLSPANFETWLKDTELVEIDDNRFRISAPNGFARDWLDNRYRPLISQTLARVSCSCAPPLMFASAAWSNSASSSLVIDSTVAWRGSSPPQM